MKIGIITGSHRKNSQSKKVAQYIEHTLWSQKLARCVYFLELAENPLPLWDESVWEDGQVWKDVWKPVSDELAECDAFVVVSPEWSGMVPPALKNFFLLCSNNELRHKPGLIIAVSAGVSGSYPVAELRMSSYKNTGICYIPDHVIVRDVMNVLNGIGGKNSPEDATIQKRIHHSVAVLGEYAKALQSVRSSKAFDISKFPYGM